MNLTQSGLKDDVGTAPMDSTSPRPSRRRRNLFAGAYGSLALFLVVYCARPEDWIPGLSVVPLAKIAGILALLAFLFSLREFRFLFPREVLYLTLLAGQLFLASLFSPVWRGGALLITLDFAKVLLIVIVMYLTVKTPSRLRQLMFIQAVSISVIAAAAIWKGRMLGTRLEGTLGGSFGDPNDLALAITISLPLCLALLFLSKSLFWKAAWGLAILVSLYTIFLTGSRGGFLTLLVTGAVFLWEFAVQGRRRYLLVLAVLAGAILSQVSGGMLVGRLKGTFNDQANDAAAYTSSQARQQLFWRSVEITTKHPIFGVGPGNFEQLSGNWHVTHNSFTQMSAEGGIPALILYVLILWSGFKNLKTAKRLSRRQTESGVLARALLASLVGYAAGSAFLTWGYSFLPYILVAYTTATLSIARAAAARAREFELSRPKVMDTESGFVAPDGEIFFVPDFPSS